jgi:uncharacterized protein YutE (UPF0331/DUF86 family)
LPVDAALLRRRLRALERYVRVLRELGARGRDAFLVDEALQDRVERNAQLAAQTCTDVALHIVAASGRASPETYADALRALADLGIVTAELADRLAGAARLRNILVHGYLDVDHGRLFDELGWIDEAAAFGTAIERWLETLPATS